MTAGQRNCYEAIGHCLDAYGTDDLLSALVAQLETRAPGMPNPIEGEHYKQLARTVASKNTVLRAIRQVAWEKQQAAK